MTVDQMTSILGRRPTKAERDAFYAGHDPGGVIGNYQPAPANPYAQALEGMNPNSRDPAERRRYKRFQQLAKEREGELKNQREREQARALVELDDDYQSAKALYTECVNTYSTETPEDVADKGAALAALEQWANGDREGGQRNFYAAAGRIADRKTAELQSTLTEARQADMDSQIARAQLEAESARREATRIKIEGSQASRKQSLESMANQLDVVE